LNDPQAAGIYGIQNEKTGQTITKAHVIATVPKEAKITKAAAAQAIDSITDSITKDLKKGGRVTLAGFGTFSVANRKARTGRNPRTDQEIRIPATKSAKFTSGKALNKTVR
jgi:DNA-binding protein HU-beta